jgi:hypothetical protein
MGEFLQAIAHAGFQESIAALLECDAALTHTVGQPVVLVEADAMSRSRLNGCELNSVMLTVADAPMNSDV